MTLIIDKPEGLSDAQIWDIYYHFHINKPCLDKLQAQVKQLLALSVSTEIWEKSEYGERMKFCDADTLNKVRAVWEFYVSQNFDKNPKAFDKLFRSGIDRARKMRRRKNFSNNMTGLRSAVPTWAEAMLAMPDLHQYFWEFGTTDVRAGPASSPRIANPMFATPNAAATLHYGLDPLLGFHLATAFIPLFKGLNVPELSVKIQKQERIVSAARAEFSSWLESFRKHWGTLTLRFFVGDAVHFSHALQSRRASGGVETGNWYSSPREMLPLRLNDADYGSRGSAPVLFSIIDTSNLIDHLGAMNLLVATSPLLCGGRSSSLYTEILVRQGHSNQEHVKNLLCGDLATISLLIGLTPIEYWTNTASTSTADENLTDMANRMGDNKSGQLVCRILWKRPMSLANSNVTSASVHRLRVDDVELAGVLYRIYLRMFARENPMKLLSLAPDANSIKKVSLQPYCRSSFVALLRLVKSRVAVD